MSIESKISGHWTDEQLIEHLYGLGPEDRHLAACQECRERVSAMQGRRRSVEQQSVDDVGFEFLAAQRRRIYAKLDQPVHWWQVFPARRWAPAAAALLVIGAGLVVVEHPYRDTKANVSDAQLAAEVSRIADDSEPKSTAPLRALFED